MTTELLPPVRIVALPSDGTRPPHHPLRMGTYVRMRTRPQADFESAMAFIEAGCGDSEIARITGIPGRTVSAWRHGRGTAYHRRLARARPSWRPTQRDQYSYLLGLYLGDGCIQEARGTCFTIVITLDASYPGIVEHAAAPLPPASQVRRFGASCESQEASQRCVAAIRPCALHSLNTAPGAST